MTQNKEGQMKKRLKTTVLILFGVFAVHVFAVAGDKDNFKTASKTNNGKKWRIGYYEGGKYMSYQKVLVATIQGLDELGWIEVSEIPDQYKTGEQTKQFWNWLSINVKSKYIEFPEDAYYSANWIEETRIKMVEEIFDRLNRKNDIDLMIAMGTWAGKDLANDKHHTPTMVLSTSDPIASGIIKSVEDSGFENIHARVDPYRYQRQVRIFHDIIGFKKLGIAYENSEVGRSYSAIDMVESVAKEHGFEIVHCFTKDEVPDVKIAEESAKHCFRELGKKKIDAIYVTVQNGINKNTVPELAAILNSFRIPSFSQYGSSFVRQGFLLSISRAGFKHLGRFHAKTFAKVFNGAKPGQIGQLFESPPKIAINLKTAEIIRYDPPVDVLGAADEIYQDIEKSGN